MKTQRPARGSPGSLGEDEADPRVLPLEAGAPTPEARCVEASLSSLDAKVTPTGRFFIRSHFAVPRIDPASWRLRIDGGVERPSAWSLDEIRGLPHRELIATLECAGNSRSAVRPKPDGVLWGHGAVSTARWRGVPLRDLLKEVGVKATALEAVFRGADHGAEPGVSSDLAYEMSVSMAKAFDAHTLVVDEMNGKPLEPSHGFPVRMIVPGWYGMASVKWLAGITVTDAPFQGHFRTREYSYIREGERADRPRTPVTTVRVKSLITWPKENSVVATGRQVIRGVAWSGESPIARVEVSTDSANDGGKVWEPAHLLERSTPYAWTHWECRCDLPNSGFYVLRVRATDELDQTQPAEAEWNFRGVGNNSIHAVPIEVRPGGRANPR